jgi:hypothetical protein
VRQKERYAWFVLLALVLLLIDGIVAARPAARSETNTTERLHA